MKEFMGQDFLLETETASKLYHSFSEKQPLIDYHCHLNPKEIYEDRRFSNISDVWFGGVQPDGSYYGDHYKWRLMRSNAIPEEGITGRDDDFKRFYDFACTLEKSIGNPMYHWCNLELHRFFGITEPLNRRNAREIYDKCNEMLANDPNCTARGFIRQSNVYYVGTTDDPIDTLEWHEKMAADDTMPCIVRPSYRPDKAININKDGFVDYLKKLAAVVGKESLTTTQEVCDALVQRAEFFKEHGCVASDHGIDYMMFRPAPMEECDEALRKVLAGEKITTEEAEKFQTQIMLALGRAYHRLGIVMEIHYGALRNGNERMFKKLGPDTGYDCIAITDSGAALVAFMSELEKNDELPKIVLFSLNAGDNEMLDTTLGLFQSAEVPGKIQHGPAWWFCDTKSGMEEHMKSLANLSVLGNFIGMLTDSRSFLSYPRHEYFRRITCNFIGNLVENGEYPYDEEALKEIVEGISFKNAKRYFGI